MTRKNYLLYVEDMILAIEKIFKYIETVKSRSDFLKNEMVIDAVTRNFEIIGEAANHIPEVIIKKYPLVPWREMYALRNLSVHDYQNVDPQILWEIAENHLLENKIMLEELLLKEKPGN